MCLYNEWKTKSSWNIWRKKNYTFSCAFKVSEVIVGEDCKDTNYSNKNTISSIKRKMWTKEMTKINNKESKQEEISPKILSYRKSYDEDKLGHTVKKALITEWAYFNDSDSIWSWKID